MSEKRGGMSRNGFGGKSRLDTLNLTKGLSSNRTPEKLLFLATIQDAIHNYLFFGLGRNGTSKDEFLNAYNYLFNVRSVNLPKSVEAKCFDIHFKLSNLSSLIDLDKFTENLKQQRIDILKENKSQVKEYISTLQVVGNKLARNRPLSRSVSDKNLFNILTKPTYTTLSKLLFLTKPQTMEKKSELRQINST